jgi:threonine dehydratase
MNARAPKPGTLPVTLADVRAAAATIAGAIERTPLAPSRTLSEICGCSVFLSVWNLQFAASFVARGALR